MVKYQVYIMTRTAQISKEKQQSIITFRHEGQSIQKMSRTLKVSSSPVAKTIKRYDETGSHEERHRKGRPKDPLLQKISSLELTAPQIAAQINYSQSSRNIHINCSEETVCLHGQIAAKKPLLKDTNKKKRIDWAKKHE